MNAAHPIWVGRIISDLQGWSAELLEKGISQGGEGWTGMPMSPAARTLGFARSLGNDLPKLLREAVEDDFHGHEVETTSSPRGDIMRTVSPSNYLMHQGELVQYRWERQIQTGMVPYDLMCWLAGVIDFLETEIEQQSARFDRQAEMSAFVRNGESLYATADLESLNNLADRFADAMGLLHSARDKLLRRSHAPVNPSLAAPARFPRTPAWLRFRHAFIQLQDKLSSAVSWVEGLDDHAEAMAEVPFLYQRWCGMHIIRSLQRNGLQTSGDVVSALYLGGALQFEGAARGLTLWVEPRLSAQNFDSIGWRSTSGEVTPDFLFVVGAPGNRDAYVIDATLVTSREVIATKGRYRRLLTGADVRHIAGIQMARTPRRSWAMAPSSDSFCVLGDAEGFTGLIPANATVQDFSGLDAFIGDVLAGA